jgi:hypothetical protein
VSVSEVYFVPIERLDLMTMEAIILRTRMLPSHYTILACYDCHGSGPLMPWRGRALCESCRVLAKVREA